MLNMIKMDVYRMFRTKSMYVIWIILLASALLTSFLSKIDYDAVNKEWEQQQADDSNKEQLSQQNEQLRNMAKALFAKGMTEEQISEMTGINVENITKLLK